MILQTVLNVLTHYKRLSPDATYVVAVSGGVDSLALLDICTQIQPLLAAPIHIATLDHGLRGLAGVQDAQYVVQVAQDAGLPVHQHTVDTLAYAADYDLGTELAARQVRYHWLADVARSMPNGVIVTAHHANDQAETLLMHILRGSGLRGLRGMQTVGTLPGHADVPLLRPLLSHTRQQITAYCQERSLQPRHDASNDDTHYRRNAIRHTLMPILQDINPNITQALNQLADNVAVDLDLLDQLVERDILPQVHYDEQRASVALALFRSWHPALQRRMFIAVLRRFAGDIDLSHERIQAAVELAVAGQVGQISEFSEGWRLRLGYNELFIEHVDQPLPVANSVQITGEFDLPYDGQTEITPGVILHTSTQPPPDVPFVWVTEGARLWVRTRRPGDRYSWRGGQGAGRKLKKWFIDHKIEQHLRDGIPLVCIDDVIVALYSPKGWSYVETRNECDENTLKIGFWLELSS